MKLNKIEKSLSNALEHAPTIPFEELAAQPYVKMTEHDYITRQEIKRNTATIRRFAFAAVMCILLLIPASGWFYLNRVPDSVILLDVNPSLKIVTNHKGDVLSVNALNTDAKELLQENTYKDTSLAETVTVIIGSMVDQNYLTTEKNTILLSVMNRNEQKANKLRTEIGTTILKELKTKNITPVILSQTIGKQTKRSVLAKQYQVSEGKMKLMEEIVAADDSYSLEALSGMSMEQLLQIANQLSMKLDGYIINGNREDINDETRKNPSEDAVADDLDSTLEDSQKEGSYEAGESEQSDEEDADEEDGSKSDNQLNREENNEDRSDEDGEKQDKSEEDQHKDSEDGNDSSDVSEDEKDNTADGTSIEKSENGGEGDRNDGQSDQELEDSYREDQTGDADVTGDDQTNDSQGEDSKSEDSQSEDTQSEGNQIEENQGQTSELESNSDAISGPDQEQESDANINNEQDNETDLNQSNESD